MSNLERAANVSLIVASAFVVANIVHARFSNPTLGVSVTEQLTRRYQGKMPPLPGIAKANAGKTATVVLFISKKCHFCAQSEPFYKHLAELRSKAPADFAMMAYVPQEKENAEDGREFLAVGGVVVDSVGSASFREVGVTGTPTIFLLDRNSHLRAVWTGALQPAGEADVLSRIHQLCSKCTGV